MTSSGAGQQEATQRASTGAKPNIVFLFTDDQDADSIDEMPNVQNLVKEQGTTFENALFALPSCCPSRASMLTGMYPHNTGVFQNENGAGVFRANGLEADTAATRLDGAGYRTALVGKYLNDYDDPGHVPPGWDRWFAGLTGTYSECYGVDGKERCFPDEVPDVVVKDKSVAFVQNNAPSLEPFVLWASFGVPHLPAKKYPKRDAGKFGDAALPKPPSFDEEDVSDKSAAMRSLPRVSDAEAEGMSEGYRNRLRSLQVADRAVGRIVAELEAVGELDDTYFVFWTDNGHHMGHHRMPSGKSTPYEEDVRFPLIVRGPGVPEGRTRGELLLNTDIGVTLADLGGAQPADDVDGRSFAPFLRGETPPWRDAVLLEGPSFAGQGIVAYQAVRTEAYKYIEYVSGERELYDLSADPHELTNLLSRPTPEVEARAAELSDRLAALRDCSGDSCRDAENP